MSKNFIKVTHVLKSRPDSKNLQSISSESKLRFSKPNIINTCQEIDVNVYSSLQNYWSHYDCYEIYAEKRTVLVIAKWEMHGPATVSLTCRLVVLFRDNVTLLIMALIREQRIKFYAE